MSDVFSQMTEQKRRRELMAQMLQQSQQAPIVGNTGLGQALAKLGTAYIVGKGNDRLDKMEADTRSRYNSEMAGELQNFLGRYQGKPGEVLDDRQAGALMNDNVNPSLAEPVKSDPQGALMAAMASRFPELQAIGKTGLPAVLKSGMEKPAAPKRHVINGKLVEDTETGSRVVGDYSEPKDKYSEPYTIPGAGGQPLLVRKNLATGKVEPVDTGVKQIVNTGDNAGIKGLVETNLPGGKGYEKASAAAESLRLGNEMVAAIGQGAKTGSLGEVQQTARKFFELAGVPNAATAPTDVLSGVAKQKVLAKLGGLGTAISNSDRDFLSSAQGDLTTDPQALKRLIAISMAGDLLALNRHSKNVRALDGKLDPSVQEAMNIGFTVEIGDPEIAAMVENVVAGKPTVAGKPGATPSNPNGNKPTRTQPSVSNWGGR